MDFSNATLVRGSATLAAIEAASGLAGELADRRGAGAETAQLGAASTTTTRPS